MENRLDAEIFRRGLARSRSAASDLVSRSKVSVNGKTSTKQSAQVNEADVIVIDSPSVFASRAGEKLSHALEIFKIDVRDLEIIDVGSSTGGFTDCLLKNGARKITAIDVGTDQLVPELRNDSRVEVREGTDVRKFKLPSPVDMAVIDVSFISLSLVLPKVFQFLKPDGLAIALVKPQFEVGMESAKKKKGIITDEKEQSNVVLRIKSIATKLGFAVLQEAVSPIKGEKGNREFLLLLKKASV
jgi:23S rRNA (cytidine1920-2'-O)/16S rRNA (cytidine1409-2'-O)-methyltransferase